MEENKVKNSNNVSNNKRNESLKSIEDLSDYERRKLFEEKSKNWPTEMSGPYGYDKYKKNRW